MIPDLADLDLLDRAILNLDIPGVRILRDTEGLEKAPEGTPDALVTFAANGTTADYQVPVVVKKWVTNTTLGATLVQLTKGEGEPLLITEYVNPNIAEKLKQHKIQFLDTVGNAYINRPPIFIYVKGNKPPDHIRTTRRAFKPTGLKIIFVFLCNPLLVNAPYRDVAKAAGVALGTVGWVIRELKETGFLVELDKRKRRLLNKEKLLERWVTDYPEKLRPNLFLGNYKALNPDWIHTANFKNFEAYWGGEAAAEKMTHYLKPEIKTIYLKERATRFLQTHRLVKDPQGDIELREMFWDFDHKWKEQNLVPPLLVYADLLATGLDRNIETAKILFENELAEYFRKD